MRDNISTKAQGLGFTRLLSFQKPVLLVSVIAIFSICTATFASTDDPIGSISELKARSVPVSTENVLVRGYYADGDGGGGLFYWATNMSSGENDGTIIKSDHTNSGRWKRVVTSPLNVRWFGAKGDGLTDDTPSIQKAINLAGSQAQNGTGSDCVLFPGGKYCLNNKATNSNTHLEILSYNPAKSIKIHLLGVGDAVLFCNKTSNTADDVLLFIAGYASDLVIENLSFSRDAAETTDFSYGLILESSSSGSVKRPIIKNCVFQDFSRALSLHYTEGALVTGCRWRYSEGRACGITGGAPNVGLWCIGASKTQIIDNYWSGTEDLSSTNLPMDGFVFGTSKGWTIKNNIARRALFEAIFTSNSNDSNSTCVIEGNDVDCELPASFESFLSSHSRNGIRADECDVIVTGNNIKNARCAIVLYSYPTLRTGGVIANNNIVFDDADSGNPLPLMGILIDSRRDATVQNNRIFFPSNTVGIESTPSAGISIANSEGIRVLENSVSADGTSPAAYGLSGVYFLNGSTGTIVKGNYFKNLGFGVCGQKSGSDNSFCEIGHNEFNNLLYPIGRYSFTANVPTGLPSAGASEVVVDLPANTSSNWYRVFYGTGFIGGQLSVVGAFGTNAWNNNYPATILDAQYKLEYDYSQLGTIQQTRSGVAYIDQVRISRNGVYLALDVHVAAQLPGKVRLVFTSDERKMEAKQYPSIYGMPIPVSLGAVTDGGYGTDSVLSIPAQPGILTSGKIIGREGIGSQIEAAGTVGSIIKRIKAYDENGNFIGYIAVYDSL